MPTHAASSACVCACPTFAMTDQPAAPAPVFARILAFPRLVALAAGAITALGQPPFGWVWAALLGLFVGFELWRGTTRVWQATGVGWAFGAGYFTASLSWIISPFMVDVARDGWMAPFALLGMGAGMALFWAAAFGLARWFGRAGGLALVICWAGAEVLRSYVLTGFPWGLVGYIWLDWGLDQLSALVGPFGLTALTFVLVWLLQEALHARRRRNLSLAFLGMLLVAGAGFGVWRGGFAPQTEGRPVIRLVQPNATQRQKWDPEWVPVFFRRQLEFTATAADPMPDLVVWPETAVPYLLDRSGSALEMISDAAAGRPVVVGIQRREGARAFNSLVLLGRGGVAEQVYDKAHLVPFGEYIPFGSLAARLGLQGFAARDGYGYSPGPGPRVLPIDGLGKAMPLICYEAIFPQEVNAAPERPDWLLQITNDAWFGRFSGPYQHLAQARFRAIEQGLPMVRVANTGVSAMIGPRGRILKSLPLGQAGFLDARLPKPLPATLYSQLGNGPLFLFLAFGAVYLLFARFRNSD